MKNKNKKVTAVILSGIIAIMPLTAYAKTTVKYNAINQVVASEPVVQGDTTMVALREYCNIFGAYVEWFSNTQEIAVEKNNKKVVLKLGSNQATVNGEKKTLSAAPEIIDEVTMVSVDLIADFFGVDISVDSQNNSINIVDKSEQNTLKIPSRGGIDITYDQVLKILIANSDDLKNSKDAIETAEKDIKESIANTAINIQKAQLSLDNLKIKDQKIRNSFEQTIISSFHGLINTESSIALQQLQLENDAKNLEILKQKSALGLISKLDLDTAQTNYEKSQTKLKNSKESLEASYRAFNILVKADVNAKYNIVYTPTYTPVEFASLDNYIAGKVLDSATVKTTKNSLKMTENEVLYYGIYKEADGTYDDKVKAFDQAERAYNDLITNLTEKMNNTYTSIKQQEKAYEVAKADLEQAKKDYELAKIQYNLGTIALTNLDKAKLAVVSAEYNIQSSLTKLVELNIKFQNADLQ